MVIRHALDGTPDVRRAAMTFCTETAVQTYVSARTLPDAFRKTWARSYEGSRTPALLVPGYSETDAVYTRVCMWLREAGIPYATLRYRDIAGDPREEAKKLLALIDEVCAETGRDEVDLVGHSLGGVVVRYAAEVLGDPRIRRVATVAAPHDGTRLAFLGPGQAAKQLRPGSPTVISLGDEPFPGLLNIYTPQDVLVGVASARLGPDDVVVPGWGHNGICFAEATCRALRDHLVREGE